MHNHFFFMTRKFLLVLFKRKKISTPISRAWLLEFYIFYLFKSHPQAYTGKKYYMHYKMLTGHSTKECFLDY